MRVGLIGHFGIGNLGNDASLDAVADSIRQEWPDATIVSICHRPADVAERWRATAAPIHVPRPTAGPQRLGQVLSRIRDVQHACQVVRTLDGLFVPGTGILDDFGGERGVGFPATLLQWFGLARLAGVPTGLLSVGAGPFQDRLGQLLIRGLVSVATYSSFRDVSSAEFVQGLGAAVDRDDVVPDVVLGLPTPSQPSPPERSLVAIAVMQYAGWYHDGLSERHEMALAELGRWAVAEGHEVLLLTADAKDRPATDRVAARVLEALPEQEHGRVHQAQASDIGELASVMSEARLAVVTRYHSLVAALVAGRPVVSVGYGIKNDDLMAAVGLGEYCQHVETVDAGTLVEQAARALQHGPTLAASVAAAVEDFRRQLEQQRRLVVRLIGRRDGRERTGRVPGAGRQRR